MSSKCQMYLKLGGSFRFPVLPEKLSVSYGSNNDRLRVCGVGEVTIIQDSDAAIIQFSSFFPKTYFSGCDYKNIPNPKTAMKKILLMKEKEKPARFTITGGMGISMYCTIENFEVYEQGGDLGTIYYTIKLKEYREVSIRQITVDVSAKKASIAGADARVDNTQSATTYTVQKNDCLSKIAKAKLGNSSRWTEIYDLNRGVIGGNPNLIYPGQVFTLPSA